MVKVWSQIRCHRTHHLNRSTLLPLIQLFLRTRTGRHGVRILTVALVLLYPGMPFLCKKFGSRSVGFKRSQLIWICTVCHSICEFLSRTCMVRSVKVWTHIRTYLNRSTLLPLIRLFLETRTGRQCVRIFWVNAVIRLETVALVLLNPYMSCLCKQCRSRSVGFKRSQLIWICTVCHPCEFFLSTI